MESATDLDLGQRKVEEVGVSLADAYEAALAHYSRQGYRLHSVAHIEEALVLFVFEKEVADPQPWITSGKYASVDTDIPVCKCREDSDA